MVYLEAEPGTLIIGADYVYGLENRSREDHEKRIDAEARALIAEEGAKQLQEHIQNYVAGRIQNTEPESQKQPGAEKRETDMTWRSAFLVLLLMVICTAVWLLQDFVIPHWTVIRGWIR